MKQTVGLCGSHRVGKSSLAEAVSKGPIKYVEVSISKMQKSLGYDSSKQDYPWEVRKVIQTKLLHKFYELLDMNNTRILRDVGNCIYDRTPIDLIGYAMWSFPKEPTEEDVEWMENYITSCIFITNKYFTKIVLIQPGIPLKESPTSAAADLDMMEAFNACYLAQFLDSRLVVDRWIMPRELLNLTERASHLWSFIRG